MVYGFDPFDDILFDEPVARNAQAGAKYRPKAKPQSGKAQVNVGLSNKLPIPHFATTGPDSSIGRPEAPSLNASNFEGMEVDHSLPRFSSVDTTLASCSSIQMTTFNDSLVSQEQELLIQRDTEASHNGELRVDNASLEREEETFPGLEYFHMNSQANASPGNWDLGFGDGVETGKQVRKRGISPEGLDVSKQEPRKKKFSHSSRRNKRRGDKTSRETPAWETNPHNIETECVTASSSFIPNQSKLSTQDAHRTSNERWSKQDTELFYEGIRQFGTDFAMLQQLFPGRTRHQVKLKYKKEERQQPLRVHDAVTDRVKEFSHFELVIEKLKKAAAAEEHRDVESLDPTDAEEEDLNLETNEVIEKFDQEEVAGKYGQEKEEVITTYSKQTIHKDINDPFKGHESEEENLYDSCWNDYQS